MRTLILAIGNPARGDDALAPLLVERLAAKPLPPGTERLAVIQLQPEMAFDLIGYGRVVLVDAGIGTPPPFAFEPLFPRRDDSWTSHRLSPWALLQICHEVLKTPPPPAFLLTISGERFDLGAPLSEKGHHHLERAFLFLRRWLHRFR